MTELITSVSPPPLLPECGEDDAFDSTPSHTPSRRSPARPQERGDYAGTSRGPYLDVYYLEGLSHTPPSSPDDILTPLNSNSSRNSTRIPKFACRVNYEARSTTACKRGDKKEGKRIFPSSKDLVEAVYAPLPRPGIDKEALDFEGGGVGVGGFPILITRQYYYSQRRAPLGAK
ncbi:hypothetical protein EV714DRAFT_277407 [Schizophyllum commune]